MKYTSEQISQINNAIPIVEYASQYLALHKKNGEYWCICPFHNDSDASMSFNKDKNSYFCFGCDSKGYLINFVMQYKKLSFPNAIEHILQLVNISLEEKEHSEIFEYLHKNNLKKCESDTLLRPYLDDNVIDQYTKEPIKEWIVEGVSQEVLDKYEVRYNKNSNAIVFPIRDFNGKIFAIKARTLYTNYKDLGLTKYKYYQSIGTNDFLFGLFQNYKSIKDKNEVIVLEGAKGVFLAESYGYTNCVSLETNRITEPQMDLLLQLKVDIVMCLDKGIKITTDKNLKNKENLTYVNIGLLPKLTNVYVMEDTAGLLKYKDCPADHGKEIFTKLYEGKYKV